MNIPLGSLLKVGGAAYGAYGDDKTESIKEALAAAANQRAVAKAALDEKIGMRDLARLGPGDVGFAARHNQELIDTAPGEGAQAGAKANAEVEPGIRKAVGITAGEAPIKLKSLLDAQTALRPGVIAEAEGVANARVPAANATHQYSVDHPLGSFSAVTTKDSPTGPDKVSTLNTHTGVVTPTDALKGGAGGAGHVGNVSGQNIQARLIGAISEGRNAGSRMDKFEDANMKDGRLNISIPEAVGAGLTTGLAGSHSPISIGINQVAGGLMNKGDHSSDVLQYQRDARLIARAEQLMAARGGSEAMASDNAFLAQGGANAPEATVRAARNSRNALFGRLGAVMQTLTPDQITKLEVGFADLARMDKEFGNKTGMEQALDAIDHAGLADEIRNAATHPPTAPVAKPSTHPLLDRYGMTPPPK